MQQKPKLCMFCGMDESFGKMSTEHFVPRCLWVGNRPHETKTVPAHEKCNNSFSGDNEYFRDILVFEHGAEKHCEARKLQQGAVKRKIKQRPGSIKKMLKQFAHRPVHSTGGVYLGHVPTFIVDWPRMQRVLFNIMKGIFYTVKETPMPQEWDLRVECVNDADLTPILDLIKEMSPWQNFGDDVFMTRYLFHDDGAMFCFMQFYRNRVFTGRAVSKEFVDELHGQDQKDLLIDNSA